MSLFNTGAGISDFGRFGVKGGGEEDGGGGDDGGVLGVIITLEGLDDAVKLLLLPLSLGTLVPLEAIDFVGDSGNAVYFGLKENNTCFC